MCVTEIDHISEKQNIKIKWHFYYPHPFFWNITFERNNNDCS